MFRQTIPSGWRRILRLQQNAQGKLLTGVLIHKPENIFYFTSFYPSEPCFLLVPTQEEPELIVAKSALAEAKRDSLIPVVAGDMNIAQTAYNRMITKKMHKHPPSSAISGVLRKIGDSPLGLEYDYLSLFLFKFLNIRKPVDMSPEINNLRGIKDSFETERLTQACHIAEQAIDHTRKNITLGMSEKEVAGIFQAKAQALGADESRCLVKSGANTALAFSRWMSGILETGPLFVDFGARVQGYWSDITRMFYLGSELDKSFLDNYELVLKARSIALDCMNPGQSIYDPEIKIRELFRENGVEANMVYSPGHGIGLEINEDPLLSYSPPDRKDEDKFKPIAEKTGLLGSSMKVLVEELQKSDPEPRFQKNQILVLEPGLFFNHLGVSIKDMIHIKDKPHILSTLSTHPEDVIIPV